MDDLFIGKFNLGQIGALAELREMGWLAPARLIPRYWTDKDAHRRLELCVQNGMSQLLQEAAA
jgi:hypothetical protein